MSTSNQHKNTIKIGGTQKPANSQPSGKPYYVRGVSVPPAWIPTSIYQPKPKKEEIKNLFDFTTKSDEDPNSLKGRKVTLKNDEDEYALILIISKVITQPTCHASWAWCKSCKRVGTLIEVVLAPPGTDVSVLVLPGCDTIAKQLVFDSPVTKIDTTNISMKELIKLNKTRTNCVKCGSLLKEKAWLIDTYKICEKCEGDK